MAVEDGRVAAEDLAGVFEQMLRREVSTSRAGSAFELEHTNPRRMSLTATFLTLKPMLMPGVGHLGRLDLRRQASGRERHDIPGLERAGLDAADGNCADAANLEHVLEREAERTFRRGGPWARAPRQVVALLDHVVADPPAAWDELTL